MKVRPNIEVSYLPPAYFSDPNLEILLALFLKLLLKIHCFCPGFLSSRNPPPNVWNFYKLLPIESPDLFLSLSILSSCDLPFFKHLKQIPLFFSWKHSVVSQHWWPGHIGFSADSAVSFLLALLTASTLAFPLLLQSVKLIPTLWPWPLLPLLSGRLLFSILVYRKLIQCHPLKEMVPEFLLWCSRLLS